MRFEDAPFYLADFVDDVLVECPRCGRCARIRCGKPYWMEPARLACGECGYSRSTDDGVHGPPGGPEDARDPLFGLPLWLRTPCCGHTLWALSSAHLGFLRSYVGARLRERTPNRNSALASRLPAWIKRRSNREAVGRAIEKLEARLAEES